MLFHYLFRVLVIEFRAVTYEYFMNECQTWELNDLIDNIPYLDRNLWDSQRLNAYITAQINSRKKLTQQDICVFKWDNKDITDFVKEESSKIMTKTDINRLKNLAKQWEPQN